MLNFREDWWGANLKITDEKHYPKEGGNTRLHSHVSKELVSWMARLRMLEGVPFRYLVPYDEILPNESIRFFHIDRNWLDALVDGAMSVARMGSREVEFDKKRYVDLMDDLHNFERDRRSYANDLLTLYYQGYTGIGIEESQEFDEEGDLILPDEVSLPSGGTLTGFLFRSSVVRDWPGIEISAFDYLLSDSDIPPNPYISGNRIQTMRQEKLSDTVMLCIFNGTPSHVRIQEPYEGMRVGVDTEGARHDNGIAYRTNLKDLNADFLCGWCDGVIDTAIEPAVCPHHPHPRICLSSTVCYKCYTVQSYSPASSWNCEGCGEDGVAMQPPVGSNDGDEFRGYDVFTRRQPGDNSVLNIQGIYDKAKEQLDGILGPGVSSIDVTPVPQDSALLAIQLLQFPYQQDFECENDYPKSVNTNPTDTSGGV